MKLTSFSILFIIIICPFLLISSIQSRMLSEDRKIRAHYDQVIDNAVQDAVFELSRYKRLMPGNNTLTPQNIRGIAAKTFTDSLFFAFNVFGDSVGMEKVKGHVPVLLFLENDGYVQYALNEYLGVGGYRIIDYSWYPKMPYSGTVDHYIVRYTLTDNVTIYDQITGQESHGLFSDFLSIVPEFGSRTEFEQRRLSAVSQTIEKDLRLSIERFNKFSMKMGVTYEFRFPRIEDSDWIRALTDESMLVFAQGFPVLTGGTYESNAFGGARILQKPSIAGYIDQGKKVYCRDSCQHFLEVISSPGFDPNNIIYFTDAREAAKAGYYPCGICRP